MTTTKRWWDFFVLGGGGGHAKNMVLKGGRQKILGIKGRSRNKFGSDGFCDKKPAFLMFRKFLFPPGSIVPDPLLF